MTKPMDFQWPQRPTAAALAEELLAEFPRRLPFVAGLAGRMRDETGTQLRDWIARIAVPPTPGLAERLADALLAQIAPARTGDPPVA